MDDPVPVVKDIAEVYYAEDLPTERIRYPRFLEYFSKLYDGAKPEFVARSPGRSCIIGEQIDHQLYEVLPMALATDILIAVQVIPPKNGQSPSFRVANTNSKFKAGQFSLQPDGGVVIETGSLDWTNYFKAGLRGATELLRAKHPDLTLCSMNVLLDGSVPAGAGVSSSAAFVCASALAVLYANGEQKPRKSDLTEKAIVAERAVGVNSGGMDQSASVFPIQGDAVSVSFFPKLHAEVIKFPQTEPPITFMVAQSFVTANKNETGPIHYNLRVVECTLAAEWLAAKHGVKLADDAGALGKSLRGFQEAYYHKHGASSSKNETQKLQEMQDIAEAEFANEQGYTRAEISSVLGISIAEIEKRYMTKFPVRAERFKLRQRAQHVFSEARRVLQFKDLLLNPPSEGLLPKLGDLMNETQRTCYEWYENSTPELADMCKIAREAGAFGSRGTGAGWGGCTVHLVPKDKVDAIRQAWEERYYPVKDPSLTHEKLEELGAVVVSEPGHGSMV